MADLLSIPALETTTPPLAAAGLSFLFIFFLYTKIWSYSTGADIGVPQIDVLSEQIRNGSVAFLTTEYSFLTVFVLALAGTLFGLFYTPPRWTRRDGDCGLDVVRRRASLSASAGWWGMIAAPTATPTTAACAGNKTSARRAPPTTAYRRLHHRRRHGLCRVGLNFAGASTCYTLLSYSSRTRPSDAVPRRLRLRRLLHRPLRPRRRRHLHQGRGRRRGPRRQGRGGHRRG